MVYDARELHRALAVSAHGGFRHHFYMVLRMTKTRVEINHLHVSLIPPFMAISNAIRCRYIDPVAAGLSVSPIYMYQVYHYYPLLFECKVPIRNFPDNTSFGEKGANTCLVGRL